MPGELIPNRNLTVSVSIDPELREHIEDADHDTMERIISFNLYKLIYYTGIIQTRRRSPSNRMKFLDQSYLIDWIQDSPEFRIDISEIRDIRGSEVLKDVSEDLGVGVSVMVAKELFRIRINTLSRLYGENVKRPDWECKTGNNRTLVVECKGASSQATSNTQRENAISQKKTRVADVRVASLTVINENAMSTNRFIDPPSQPDDNNNEWKNKAIRAAHYSSVFSFLGHAYLSRYYSQMRKRLLNKITPNEQSTKNKMFNRLRNEYPEVEFLDHSFAGTFYEIENEKYFFVGIDKSLLSYEGFNLFEGYDSEVNETISDNQYVLFKDGILLIEINNVSAFDDLIDKDKISSYQENNTISDVDDMSEVSFERYFEYVLEKLEFEIFKEKFGSERGEDILAYKNDKGYIFEFKLTKDRIRPEVIERLYSLRDRIREDFTIVLVTNAKGRNFEIRDEQITVIGRDELKLILKDNAKLNGFLGIEE